MHNLIEISSSSSFLCLLDLFPQLRTVLIILELLILLCNFYQNINEYLFYSHKLLSIYIHFIITNKNALSFYLKLFMTLTSLLPFMVLVITLSNDLVVNVFFVLVDCTCRHKSMRLPFASLICNLTKAFT